MNRVLQITVATVFFLLSLQVHGARIEGYQKLPDGDYQFSRYIQTHTNSQFYLSFTALSPEDVTLTLQANGSITDLARFSLEPGTEYKFPPDEKSITLSEPGSYTFVIKANKSDKVDSLTILVEQPKQSFSSSSETITQSMNIRPTEGNSVSAFSTNIAQYSQSYKAAKPLVNTTSSRSAGSKIYKQYSRAVPLIESENSLGSGVFIKSDLILTNKHVVGDASQVRVALKPSGFAKVKNARRYEGTVIKYDDEKDLALVKLNLPVKDVPRVELATEDNVEVAMQVHAIGHPRGEYWSYTLGYVSQLRPEYSWLDYSADVIQTQTPINPGNSGGPLLDSEGRLVGINSFGNTESPGMNYAVAFTSVKEFLESKASVVTKKKPEPNKKEPYCEDDRLESGAPITRCDNDHNGVADRYLVDETAQGGFFEVYFDKNENKIFELMLRVVPIDGAEDVWIFHVDANEIQEWTRVGADYDRDWTVDEWL